MSPPPLAAVLDWCRAPSPAETCERIDRAARWASNAWCTHREPETGAWGELSIALNGAYWGAASILPEPLSTVETRLQLRSLRIREGLSQSDLARRIGVSPSFVSKLESGGSGVTLETVERLAAALDACVLIRSL